jgi:hypothetical protein
MNESINCITHIHNLTNSALSTYLNGTELASTDQTEATSSTLHVSSSAISLSQSTAATDTNLSLLMSKDKIAQLLEAALALVDLDCMEG